MCKAKLVHDVMQEKKRVRLILPQIHTSDREKQHRNMDCQSEKQELSKANVSLGSPGGQVNCMGQFQTCITYKAKQYDLTIYIVNGLTVNNLLSTWAGQS